MKPQPSTPHNRRQVNPGGIPCSCATRQGCDPATPCSSSRATQPPRPGTFRARRPTVPTLGPPVQPKRPLRFLLWCIFSAPRSLIHDSSSEFPFRLLPVLQSVIRLPDPHSTPTFYRSSPNVSSAYLLFFAFFSILFNLPFWRMSHVYQCHFLALRGEWTSCK